MQQNTFRGSNRLAVLAVLMLALLPTFLLHGGEGRQAKLSRIDPAGIEGSLLLCGGNVSQAAMAKFAEVAGGDKARLVLVQIGKADDPAERMVEMLVAVWKSKQPASVTLLRANLKNDPLSDADSAILQNATGVWITCANETEQAPQLLAMLEKSLHSVLKRRGIVAASGRAAALLGLYSNLANADSKSSGIGLLPESLILLDAKKEDSNPDVSKFLVDHPGLVGYELSSNSAMLVQGRRITSIGESSPIVHLPASKIRPAEAMELTGRRKFFDLTTLRRSARDRTGPQFPPEKPGVPEVEKGTLVIVGGGGMPKGLIERFVELAGGKEAHIVVLPTAVDPAPKRDRIATAFEKAGAKTVTVLPGRTIDEVESPEYIEAFRKATGIWFGGGRQWRFVDAYEGTKVHPLMHEVLQRGGVIGGSSAGASIQAEYMARGSYYENFTIMADGYERGLGFLKGAAVDQHFSQRKRHKDMTALIKQYPQLLGIGIDEATAIIVRGHIAEVVGRGKVHFYDARRQVKDGEPDYEALTDGGSYDLKARRIIRTGKKTEEPKKVSRQIGDQFPSATIIDRQVSLRFPCRLECANGEPMPIQARRPGCSSLVV